MIQPTTIQPTTRQTELAGLLIVDPAGCPIFATDLVRSLRADIEEAFAELAQHFSRDEPLWIGKRQLASVHACQGNLLAQDQDTFAWNRFNAKGTMLHWAIERELVPGPAKTPFDRVDDAFAHFANQQGEGSIGQMLDELGDSDLHELKRDLNDLFVKFVTDWPGVPRQLAPRAESRVSAYFNEYRILAEGKPDLTVGKPLADTSTMVLVDFKSGQQGWHDLSDLRFYALLETFRSGIPPARIFNYYLDGGMPISEEVTDEVLRSAALRLVDGAFKIVEARAAGFDAVPKTLGPQCRWCALNAVCDVYAAAQSSH